MLALTLGAQKKSVDARKALDRASQLTRKIEIREARLSTATLLARANSLLGNHDQALRSLNELLEEASKLGLAGVQLNIKLAIGEVEVKSGNSTAARRRLTALRDEASGKGYGLVAKKAGRALASS